MDEILWYDHLSESHSSYSQALLFYDIVLDTVQYGQYISFKSVELAMGDHSSESYWAVFFLIYKIRAQKSPGLVDFLAGK